MLKRTGRKAPGRPGTPRTTEEDETWPYTDPGTRWEIPPTHMPIDWSGVMVDWESRDEKIGSIFLPDGEEVEVWNDPVPFGFARYLDEIESEQAE